MRIAVSTITRRAGGLVASRPSYVDGHELSIGRATDCDIALGDLRLRLHHARLRISESGAVLLEAVGDGVVKRKKSPIAMVELSVGSEEDIRVGPYRIRLEPGGEEADHSITFELVEAVEAPITPENERSVFDLRGGMPSKRLTAWLLFLLILTGFLALPLAYILGPESTQQQVQGIADTPDRPWLTGEMSTAHANLVGECSVCHERPFVAVRDQVCLDCHIGIRDHGDPGDLVQSRPPAGPFGQVLDAAQAFGKLPEGRCGSCHREHNGHEDISPLDQQFCADCHRDMEARLPETALLPVEDFGAAHPEFRPTVVTEPDPFEPTIQRISLAEQPKERSGLVFPHKLHLDKTGAVAKMARELDLPMYFGAPEIDAPMQCSNCHEPDEGGVLFRPIQMERHCSACHSLAFAKEGERERLLPHGRPKEVISIIRDFYQSQALSSVIGETESAVQLRRPGVAAQNRSNELRRIAFARAEEGSRRKVREIFSEKGVCYGCHEVTPPSNPDAIDFDVEGVALADQFLPKSYFRHESHMTSNLECSTCHKAESSEQATDLLVPGIAVCRDCHAGEEASSAIPSSCVMCHWYHGHEDEQPAMTPAGIPPVDLNEARLIRAKEAG